MDNGILGIAGAFVAGLGLGAAYCAMLWFAVRRLCAATPSVAWLLATGLPRLGVPVAGFYWALGGGWERLAACLAGFVLMRIIVQRRLGRSGSAPAAAS